MTIPEREYYENGRVRLLVDVLPDKSKRYWIESGVACLYLEESDVEDLYDLLHALVAEE